MHYIKDLVGGGGEDWMHELFLKYGRGEYLGPVCWAQVKKLVKFKASVEYANALGYVLALQGGIFEVKGSIFGKSDFRGDLESLGLDFDDASKQKKGLYVAVLDDELGSDVLVQVFERLPQVQPLLNLRGDSGKLKCKKKPPKPGKEKDLEFAKGQVVGEGFGKLVEEVYFDLEAFREATVENTFVVDELLIPEGMAASEARVKAKRKGRLIRKVVADGNEKTSEYELLV